MYSVVPLKQASYKLHTVDNGFSFDSFINNGRIIYTTEDKCYFAVELDPGKYKNDISFMSWNAGRENPYFYSYEAYPKNRKSEVCFGIFDNLGEKKRPLLDVFSPDFFDQLDKKRLIGFGESVVYANDPQHMVLDGAYIQKYHRGQNLSQLLHQARIDWASNNGITKISTYPCENNKASVKSAEKFGFILQPDDTKLKKFGIGNDIEGTCLHYLYDISPQIR